MQESAVHLAGTPRNESWIANDGNAARRSPAVGHPGIKPKVAKKRRRASRTLDEGRAVHLDFVAIDADGRGVLVVGIVVAGLVVVGIGQWVMMRSLPTR